MHKKISAREIFESVALELEKDTNQNQISERYEGLNKDFYFYRSLKDGLSTAP